MQQAVAQLPWGHNLVLIDKIKDKSVRKWYTDKAIQNGWSRNVLTHQIELNLYERQVLSGKVQNFSDILPSPQSELAMQTMKDPYIFDFITADENSNERHIETELVKT